MHKPINEFINEFFYDELSNLKVHFELSRDWSTIRSNCAKYCFIVENKKESNQKITMKGVIEVVGDKTLLIVSFLAILFQLLVFATVFGFTPVYAQSLGASKFDMGLLTFFSTVPMEIAAWIGGGFLSKRFGEKKVIIAGFIIIGIFTIVIPILGYFLIIHNAVSSWFWQRVCLSDSNGYEYKAYGFW
ncbi:MFS transporter [Neobacillus mesonae]|uniref:MFS transporter n=1 Tax=Neobacillus mesonae TaxID=1193713 RepID=UPI00203BFCC2|nr:MFS transporter [Neobacillus mesonae]MCM3568102.1 MFS transporter [Neobacillus mesonae]